ncbi:MAG: sporulation protein YlmC with PRC-barrel domain [Planctomycetaceae bacterium]|jgi:sporulation protein YlmC with PRC-barrel domain
MLRYTLISATILIFTMAGFAASTARGQGPFSDVVDTARGLFGVDVDVKNGVRVRAGLINIHVDGDDSRNPDQHGSAWLFRGQHLIGTPVMDHHHKDISVVDDVVIDLRSGKVRYVAVEYPTLRGRDKLFAVPWDRFRLARRENGGFYLVVNVDEELFERAPGFVRAEWPNYADRRWAKSVDIYYGVYIKPGDAKTRFGTEPDPIRDVEHLERVSKINGLPVIAEDTERPIGAVSDVVIDFSTGHARYAVLHFPNSIGIEDRRFAVPLEKLDYETERGEACLELEVDRRKIARAPSFEDKRWPNMREPQFAAQVDSYYGVKRR